MNPQPDPLESLPSQAEVAIVGAGLAGLTAAAHLARAGHDVHIFEPCAAPGGRVRTEVVDGHLLDLGFQVLLTGYPAVQEELDLDALKLCGFEPGAVVVRDGRHYSLPDPFRTPGRFLEALRFPLATPVDKWKTMQLRNQVRGTDVEAPFQLPERMAAAWLRDQGFSERFLATFWIPFFSAVFLDPPLEVTTRLFSFVFRSIALGDIALPAEGMGAIPRQLAARLPEGSLHYGWKADSLLYKQERVHGLRLRLASTGAGNGQGAGDGQGAGPSGGGEGTPATREIHADRVILACGPEEARRLTDLPIPNLEPLGVSIVYFCVEEPVTRERRIFLNGGGSSPAHHAVFLSNICPSYAPPGSQLISITVLGVPAAGGSTLAERVRRQMAIWFPRDRTETWRWLATYQIPFAQFRQPPGLLARLPEARTSIGGLFLAGDYTRHCSVQGAIESGQRAAREVMGG